MSQHEQLIENYEDALFKLLMEAVIEHEGKQIQEEIERLNSDPSFSVPPELDRRCIRTINKIARRKRMSRTGKKIYRVFSKFSVAAVIALALFTSAYAAFPEVRVSTLNILIEVSDIATELKFGDADDINAASTDSALEGKLSIAGYALPESITEGRRLVRESSDALSSVYMYEGTDGSIIIISVQIGSSSVTNVNTENALQIQNLNVDGFEGVIAEQMTVVTAGIADVEKYNLVTFQFEGIDFSSAVETINEFIRLN